MLYKIITSILNEFSEYLHLIFSRIEYKGEIFLIYKLKKVIKIKEIFNLSCMVTLAFRCFNNFNK